VSEENPDEDFTEGPSVAFAVAAPPPPKKKFPWWILAVVGGVLLLIIIAVVVWLLVRDTGPKTATVPTVTQEPRAVAQNRLTDAGFTVNTQFTQVADREQHGLVQSQDPAGGTVKPVQTQVTITVGRMPTVPNVKGLTQAQATSKLAEAGLGVSVRNIGVTEPRQDGLVQSQDPAEGTLQPPGTVVTITVGRNVVVPSVVRRPVEIAVDIISRAGLNPVVVRVHVPLPIEPGIVQSQTPPGGARSPLGGSVRINVFVSP
jgi:serine/threonine-protein kinase